MNLAITRRRLRDTIDLAATRAECAGIAPEHAQRLRDTAGTIRQVTFGTYAVHSGAGVCGCPATQAGLVDDNGHPLLGVDSAALAVFTGTYDNNMRHLIGPRGGYVIQVIE